MEQTLQYLDLSIYQWALLIVCGIFVGMGKTGIGGLGLLVVPLLATAFGGKYSAGLLLPMLAFADIFGVSYYNRHAEWKYVLQLLPWAIAGILLGLWVGENVNDEQFKELMALIILVSLGIMIWRERKKGKIPEYWWFSALVGLAGGFATMIGNAAGPIMAVYLLSMHLPKNSYIGTGAWFFLIINYFKIPLHIFFWNTITWESFTIDVAVFPFIFAGAWLGFKMVKLIPEKAYRIFVIITTAIASIRLLF